MSGLWFQLPLFDFNYFPKHRRFIIFLFGKVFFNIVLRYNATNGISIQRFDMISSHIIFMDSLFRLAYMVVYSIHCNGVIIDTQLLICCWCNILVCLAGLSMWCMLHLNRFLNQGCDIIAYIVGYTFLSKWFCGVAFLIGRCLFLLIKLDRLFVLAFFIYWLLMLGWTRLRGGQRGIPYFPYQARWCIGMMQWWHPLTYQSWNVRWLDIFDFAVGLIPQMLSQEPLSNYPRLELLWNWNTKF